MIFFDLEKTKTFGFAAILFISFLFLCYTYLDFTIDDAYIAWRYSKNLAIHGTLTWNIGQDPVEGFSSFLWVILNAGALSFGVSPSVFSKGLSVISVLIIITILLKKGSNYPWYLRFGLPAALALSPAVAVITVQGLETMLTSLFLLAVSIISIQIIRNGSRREYILFYTLSFVSGLARPDSLFFVFGVFTSILVILFIINKKELYVFTLCIIPFFLMGVFYMYFRLSYFGYLLPNTAYVKSGGLGSGLIYSAKFFSDIFAPYAIITGVLISGSSEKKSLEVTPIIVGLTLFFAYMMNIRPVQGYLGRFGMPVLPSLLYACFHLPWPISISHWRSRAGTWAIGVALLIWPLQTYPDANEAIEARLPQERIKVGRALHGIEGKLYTTESGAMAYFSEWKVIDSFGLNSERIAHSESKYRGALNVLQSFDPDLISEMVKFENAIGYNKKPAPYFKNREAILEYARKRDYIMFASTKRNLGTHTVHMVNPYSDKCDRIVSSFYNLNVRSDRHTEINVGGIKSVNYFDSETAIEKICRDRSVNIDNQKRH